jgi:hypothetical protein
MTLGRRTSIFLLAFGMLLSQQAAVLHAVSHLDLTGDPRAARNNTVAIADDQAATADFCLECLAFAQVATVASGTPVVVAFSPAPAIAVVTPMQGSQDPAVLPPFLARAPPTLL